VRSLFIKLILAFLLITLTGAAVSAVLARQSTEREFGQLVQDQSQNRFVTIVTDYYEVYGSWDGILQFMQSTDLSMPGMLMPFNGRNNPQAPYALVDSYGQVIIPFGQYDLNTTVTSSDLSSGIPIKVDNVLVGTVINAAAPALDARQQAYLDRISRALLLGALGSAAVALLLGILLARTFTQPLRELTGAIQSMAEGKLKQAVPVRSHDELGKLTIAFNQMSSQLSQANDLRRQMTADIAHDLRSPLTVISGYIESLRDGVLKPTPARLDAIYDEVQHLQRLVDDLHTLSQADAGNLTQNRQSVAPQALLERIAAWYGHLAEAKNISMEVKTNENLPNFLADPDRMAQVLENLVGNALRYTPDGGKIVLSANSETDRVVLKVEDNGKGIEPEALPHIFERFYRADESRQGNESGLGLAIAKAIVELNGGSITATSEGIGKGSSFVVSMPAVKA
jgi:signal transduction histidine kinase